MTHTKFATRKIGANRGALRIWLEGAVLTNAGFNNGDMWRIAHEPNMVTIIKDPQGKRKIAGTPARPIIDINSTDILSAVGETGDIVTIYTLDGCLKIIRSPK